MTTKQRTWQRRRNAAFALLIVLAILFLFNYLVYAVYEANIYMLALCGLLSLLPLYNFPWHKFK